MQSAVRNPYEGVPLPLPGGYTNQESVDQAQTLMWNGAWNVASPKKVWSERGNCWHSLWDAGGIANIRKTSGFWNDTAFLLCSDKTTEAPLSSESEEKFLNNSLNQWHEICLPLTRGQVSGYRVQARITWVECFRSLGIMITMIFWKLHSAGLVAGPFW